MLLAELEVFHSRPIAPTRRVALGVVVLPTTPAPGFGGLLLAAVASSFLTDTDEDHLDDLLRLAHQIEQGGQIAQPRLRHRFQEDRVGLHKVRHRLYGTSTGLHFDIDESGSPEPNVLAAVYAVTRLSPELRGDMMGAVRRGLGWQGELGERFVAYVSERQELADWSKVGGRDPVVWAMEVLGLTTTEQGREAVQEQFRTMLKAAHPDHGGESEHAANRISELTEARRILLAR